MSDSHRASLDSLASLDDVYAYIDDHAIDYIGTLQRFLQQPSIAAQGLGMTETADIVNDLLSGLGFNP